MSQSKKICPFMSSHDHKVYCTPECKLHKGADKGGYECAFQEISAISWNTKKAPKQNSNQAFAPRGNY